MSWLRRDNTVFSLNVRLIENGRPENDSRREHGSTVRRCCIRCNGVEPFPAYEETVMGRYCAWRFSHPDFDTPDEPSGIGVSPTGGIDMVNEANSIRQALILLLSTRPSERVMRPTYGCHLNRLVFSPNDDTTAGLAIHYVNRRLELCVFGVNVWQVVLFIVDQVQANDDSVNMEMMGISRTPEKKGKTRFNPV